MSIQCIVCWAENPDDAVNCISCGSPLNIDNKPPSEVTSALHLQTGTSLKQGRYKIEKTLGQGGFGITYKGIDSLNSNPVAIKELWPEKGTRQGTKVIWPYSIPPAERLKQINKFKLEASYVQKCVHPNIVKVYEWFDENDTVYIIMEFLSGKSLYKILQDEGRIAENRVKKYFLEIAQALQLIHANNFLHRDIKPDNIIIDQQDRAVLIDFGATREFIAGQTREMSVTLTHGYAPYEQYSYKSKRFPATDIYALCASMYELLTGELPVEASERANILLQGKSADPLINPQQLRPDLSELTARVILTGMRINVGERFQSALELIDALNGKFISPLQRQARELVQQGKLTEAIQTYQQCLHNEPSNGTAAVELALVQIHLDDNQAEIAARRGIQIAPNDGRGYGVLGLVNCRKGNWSDAVKNLQKASSLSPQEAWIQANLAWASGKSGDWQQATMAINKALQIDNKCTFSLGLQAWIAVNQKQWKLAIRSASQVIFKTRNTSSINTQKIQRWVYPYLIFALQKAVVTQQSQDVERRLEEFIAQVPDSAFAWGFKGWKLAQKGLWAEALPYFERAGRQSGTSIWILLDYGITQEHLNDIRAAIQVYENCHQKVSTNPFALFRLGTLLGQLGDWKNAQKNLEKAINLKPDFAEAYHNLGWVLLRIKTPDGSVEHPHELLSAYRQAYKYYIQQNKYKQAQIIQQAFQRVGVEL